MDAIEASVMYDDTTQLTAGEERLLIFMQYQTIVGGLTWDQVMNENPDHVFLTVYLYNMRKKRENESLKTSK